MHVSEIRHERIGHPNQVLHPGDRVRVRVLRLEPGKDGKPRIALSIKAAGASFSARSTRTMSESQAASPVSARVPSSSSRVREARQSR